jgi:hypothetical protein
MFMPQTSSNIAFIVAAGAAAKEDIGCRRGTCADADAAIGHRQPELKPFNGSRQRRKPFIEAAVTATTLSGLDGIRTGDLGTPSL